MIKNIPVSISTQTTYLLKQSDPENLKFVWAYKISIHNQGNEIIQLLSRLWYITDLTGNIEEVKGSGVIGLQPIIKPDKSFTYTSFCQLTTPQGTMDGQYEMQDLDEVRFTIIIPNFILCAPRSIMKRFRPKLH